MPKIDAHEPGTFCWIELGTTDQDAAKAFYSEMFGWRANDFPMGPSETYTMFDSDGQSVSAAYKSDHGVAWNLYIAVADADASAAEVEALGGKLIKDPFDVFDVGRMAVVADPTGAVFCIWQAKRNKGMDVVGEENAFCWADLSTPDPAKAKEFYEGLFGWKIVSDPRDPSGYLHIESGGRAIGGVQSVEQRGKNAPPHWLAYFQTADCDKSVDKAREHGAHIYMPPLSMPNVGRFAILADPQGAVFALFEPPHAA